MSDTAGDCLFCAVVAGEVPATVVYRDDELVAFTDLYPQAPVHLLVVPVAHHTSAAELARADPALAGRALALAGRLAADHHLDDGYRVVANTGRDGGQTVLHTHFHLLGGRAMGWPPG